MVALVHVLFFDVDFECDDATTLRGKGVVNTFQIARNECEEITWLEKWVFPDRFGETISLIFLVLTRLPFESAIGNFLSSAMIVVVKRARLSGRSI